MVTYPVLFVYFEGMVRNIPYRELLIHALLKELSEDGLGSGDEPNQQGVEVEAAIDVV